MDTIHVTGLGLECIVGLNPRERHTPQLIRVDLALGLDLTSAGLSGRIAETCDYDQVANDVIQLLRFRRYYLIEVATAELAAMILGLHPKLASVRIRLEKPSALEGRAAGAGVQIERPQAPAAVREGTAFGHRTVLLENREACLELIELEPNAEVLPGGGVRRDLHRCLTGSLIMPKLLEAGDALVREAPRDALRAGPNGARLFRCQRRPRS